VASVRLDPQVSLPGGRVQRHKADTLSVSYDDVTPLKVDRYCVTNGDFMYAQLFVSDYEIIAA